MAAERSFGPEKAPDAFRTISEVAEELDLPQHVLRFWETRFGQIRPLKRGGGRRYYRPEDVDLLRGIKHLLYGEGYTIRGVQRILKSQGQKFVQTVWRDPGSLAAAEADDAARFEEDAADEAYADEPAPPPIPAPAPAPAPVIHVARTPPPEEILAPRPLAIRPVDDEPSTEPPRLSDQAMAKLRATLLDLVEAKRLLDGHR
jgi:DNA-binding transcriptional MerR regulator